MNPTPKLHAADASEGDLNSTQGRDSYQARSLNADTRAILAADERAYMRQSMSTPCLNVLQRARGTIITDHQGRELLDFHGNSVHQVGHGHPRVVEALKRQLDELPFCTRRYTNVRAIELAERLSSLTGGVLSKVLLAPGGAQAMGMALKLARLATGRFKTISMWGAFHGASLDTISVGGEAVFRSGIGPLLPGCEHVFPCAPSRCALGCGGTCTMACADSVEEVLRRERDVAAVVAEPIRCTTIDLPTPDYWRRVRAACDRHGALLIFDEIPTCLGRTGKMFSFEHYGVVPDILAIGKGLGGGIMPQAAMLERPELDVGGHISLGHYTHEKSPLGCAAALATLDIIRDENLIERSAIAGEKWKRRLSELLEPTGMVREVRGLGLLVGVELKVPAGDSRTLAQLSDQILYDCLEQGLNFKVSDGRVLTLTPPLTVSDTELDSATLIVERAIRRAANQF
jgi:4-aminobutyrate aminotransferase